MARKEHAHNRPNEGIETAQTSVELQVETSQIHHQEGELLYSNQDQVEDEWPKNNSYSNAASMRKLINEESFKQSGTRNNAPNLVARLMGLDMMPLDTESIVNHGYSNVASVRKLINEELTKQPGTRNNAPNLVARLMGLDMMPLGAKSIVLSDKSISENMEKKISKKGMNGRDSSNFSFSSQMKFDSFYGDIGDGAWGQNFGKPKPRRHTREDEVRKFKREFEACQAARFKECSKGAENGSISQRMNAQESLNKEIVLLVASSKRGMAEKSVELDSHSFKEKLNNGDMMEPIPAKQKETLSSRSRTLSKDFEESLMVKSRRSRLDTSPPTQIVVLKPGPDSICNCNHEENWINLSGTLQGRISIEDLLGEVRERLICELQGKTVKKGSAVRGRGTETPYIEKPSNPKEIAQHISNGVGGVVTGDVEANLLRSESTRSYKSGIELNESSSPEFINRGATRLLSKRLRNVAKSEVHFDIPGVTCRNSGSYILDMSHCQTLNDEKEGQAGLFRREPDYNILLRRELLPRSLVRSLSAPVSGTSLGRFLPEDHHILRKLEADETMRVDVKKKKKHRFNIKEKVSNFKHRLGLRGKLFAKRIQSMVEPHGREDDFVASDIRSGPTFLMKHGERHENSTEVPPSPASLCSTSQEDLCWWTGYSSLTPAPCLSSIDDNVMPQVYKDISSGLNELSQLKSDGREDFIMKPESSVEYELVQLQDPAESYIRDLLVASGLYFGSCDKHFSRGDTFTKPIGNSILEEVEEYHKKYLIKENNERFVKGHNENKLDHKVLLDLLNEALSIVLGPPLTLSRFRRKLDSSCMQPSPCGKELLKLVWDIIHVSLYPPSNSSFSLDGLVDRDLGSISWYGLINDEINVFEREIACLITDDLVEELTKDM